MTKKRGRDEGSIYQIQDGRWVAAVSLGYRNGKRARKKFYGRTQKDVRDQLIKARRDLQTHLPVGAPRQTVTQFLEYWLDEVERQALRPRTYASYRQVINKHIAPHLGRIVLEKLSPQHVQQFLNTKKAGGLSSRTVSYFRAVLRSALEHAVKTNLVARNVAKLVQPPKTERYSPRFLSPEDAKKLFALAEAEDGGAVFSIALAMGLRLGEALGLKWTDVDLAAGELHVRQALQAITKATAQKYGIRPGLQLMPLKTERSRRTLQMPEPIIERLKAHRRAQLESRLAAGKDWVDTGLIFTNSIGRPLDSANLRKRFKVLANAIGIPRLRLHDLRHSCATLLLAQGVSERTIMEILGHSQISLTLNTYTHVLDGAKKEAASRMATVLSSAAVE